MELPVRVGEEQKNVTTLPKSAVGGEVGTSVRVLDGSGQSFVKDRQFVELRCQTI